MLVCDPIDNREDVHSLIVALMFWCEQLLNTESKKTCLYWEGYFFDIMNNNKNHSQDSETEIKVEKTKPKDLVIIGNANTHDTLP